MTHAYAFKADAARSLLDALGLQDRKVARIELYFEIGQPARMVVHEYALYEHLPELVRVLEGIDWRPVDETS